MRKIRYGLFLLAVCLLLTSCHSKKPPEGGTTKLPSTSTSGESIEDPVPEILSFDYGRLTLANCFAKMEENGIDFTLNFDKKIITPGDDIVLTVYVTNNTGDALNLKLEQPIVSLQQLIHASLTYGNGQYVVPVTVAYTEESDLVGGAFDVNIRNRKLLATKVTFHTSAYENIEDSIFHEKYADSYEMTFWFGEDEYTYRAQTDLAYQAQNWEIADELQSLILPEQYIRLVDDIQFTVSFAHTVSGTDDDIRMNVKVENIGKAPITLAAPYDVSKPSAYIRAELTYGEQSDVRDNVASPSEIAGMPSEYLLKYNESLEREITFYTSEFHQIKRSVYHESHFEKCILRVWLMVEGQSCEIEIPLTYGDYLHYSYTNREVPPIIVIEPVFTETTTTAAITKRPIESDIEPEETIVDPVETTGEPVETTTPEEIT